MHTCDFATLAIIGDQLRAGALMFFLGGGNGMCSHFSKLQLRAGALMFFFLGGGEWDLQPLFQTWWGIGVDFCLGSVLESVFFFFHESGYLKLNFTKISSTKIKLGAKAELLELKMPTFDEFL